MRGNSVGHRIPVDEPNEGHKKSANCPCKPQKLKLKNGTLYLHQKLPDTSTARLHLP